MLKTAYPETYFSNIFQGGIPLDPTSVLCPPGTHNTPAGYFQILTDYFKFCGEHWLHIGIYDYRHMKNGYLKTLVGWLEAGAEKKPCILGKLLSLLTCPTGKSPSNDYIMILKQRASFRHMGIIHCLGEA